jgi:hypothetical protein
MTASQNTLKQAKKSEGSELLPQLLAYTFKSGYQLSTFTATRQRYSTNISLGNWRMELLQRLSPRSPKARKSFYYFDMARSGSTCLKFKTLRSGHDTIANNISNPLLPTSRVAYFVLTSDGVQSLVS